MERETFGKKIIEHQAVATMLADMAIGVEASRLCTYPAQHGKQTKEERIPTMPP